MVLGRQKAKQIEDQWFFMVSRTLSQGIRTARFFFASNPALGFPELVYCFKRAQTQLVGFLLLVSWPSHPAELKAREASCFAPRESWQPETKRLDAGGRRRPGYFNLQ